MIIRLSTCATIGLALCAACHERPPGNGAELSHADSAGIFVVTLHDSLAAYPAVAATGSQRLRGAPVDLFRAGNPQMAVPLRDGRTLLSDGEIVAVFDSTGAYAGIAMPKGRGPGEVAALANIWQTVDDSLWIADYATRRLSRVSPALRYLRGIDYPRSDETGVLAVVGLLNGDTTAIVEFSPDPAGPPGLLEVRYRLGIWPMGGRPALGAPRKARELQRFADGVLPPGVPGLDTPYDRAAQWVAYGRCMLYGFPDRWELRIESADSSGRFADVALLRAPNDVPPEIGRERKERFIRQAASRLPERGPVTRAQLGRVMREHLIFPTRVPSFGRVMVSDDGAIWVQRFRESAEREPDRWTIVDARGMRSWRFELPSGSQVLAVRPQGVLVATRDADDVESQVWLRLPGLADVKLLPTCRLAS